jgi:hypothetical protein
VSVLPGRSVFLELEEFPGQCWDLVNLSSSGIAFSFPDSNRFPLLQRLNGFLLVKNERMTFAAEVVRRDPTVVAARFLENQVEIRKMLLDYFDIELRARGMVSVRQEMLKKEPDGQPSLFRSANGFELFLVEASNGEILYFYVSFRNHYFEGGRGRPLMYGQVKTQVSEGLKYKGSDLVSQIDKIPKDVRVDAVRLLKNVEELPFKQMSFLCEAIEA